MQKILKESFKIINVVVIFTILLTPVLVFGATFSLKELFQLSKDEEIKENLYVVSKSIEKYGNVTGDVVAIGEKMKLEGVTTEDALILGMDVDVLGDVNKDVRVAAGDLFLNNTIRGDLVAVTGKFTSGDKSKVMNDALIVSSESNIEGFFDKDLIVFGNSILLNAEILGNVKITSDSKIIIGPKALIHGDLVYSGSKDISYKEGALVKGVVSHKEIIKSFGKDDKNLFESLVRTFNVISFVVTLLTSLVFVFLFKRFSTQISDTAISSFWKSLGLGTLFLFVVPFVILALIVTFIGVVPAMLIASCFLLFITVSFLMTGPTFGRLLFKYLSKERKNEEFISLREVIVGALVLNIITYAPILGALTAFVLFLAVFGSIALSFKRTLS